MLDRRSFLHATAGAAGPLLALAEISPAAETGRAPPTAGSTRQYSVAPQINPDLRAHGAIFERKIRRVGDNVYSAVGWSIGNTIMVIGGDGVIIVDTGSDIQSSRKVAAEFRKITDQPVRAVIYTAFHLDHIGGVKAYATAEDVKAERIAIIAQESLLANVIKQSVTIGPILGIRTAYNFGGLLSGADVEGVNNGTGPGSSSLTLNRPSLRPRGPSIRRSTSPSPVSRCT